MKGVNIPRVVIECSELVHSLPQYWECFWCINYSMKCWRIQSRFFAENNVICIMSVMKSETFSVVKHQSQKHEQSRARSPHSLPLEYMTKTYKSASRYALKSINSVILKDGKIYNLLEQDNDKRIITCGCVKSNCEAKYCECFRWGETCSEKCSCVGCKNKVAKKQQPPEQKSQGGQGCNCVKSGCRKKYCECYQRGRKCDQSCNCRGCLNK